ncbi:hypothetical protein [Alteraurantiacibacter buctensis]|uniref:DUF4267 domain-containing protein n=1 Tax=Alteraurantiacibacter buctensis TaxID=1503981 RepID=A0A844YTP0_9SPHN|nr:hypothetical protein [Alteraurantiacibacter buctensis]MXO71685.1 hypothetical protein [Alteraurantiacibacter buctensis]
MAQWALLLAAALCVVTASIHSVLGEIRLIGPVIHSQARIMREPLARQVLRFAWHWTSVLWLVIAGVLVSAGTGSFVDRTILLAIATAHILGGLADAAITRGKHIGWPFILSIGALTLFAVVSNT